MSTAFDPIDIFVIERCWDDYDEFFYLLREPLRTSHKWISENSSRNPFCNPKCWKTQKNENKKNKKQKSKKFCRNYSGILHKFLFDLFKRSFSFGALRRTLTHRNERTEPRRATKQSRVATRRTHSHTRSPVQTSESQSLPPHNDRGCWSNQRNGVLSNSSLITSRYEWVHEKRGERHNGAPSICVILFYFYVKSSDTHTYLLGPSIYQHTSYTKPNSCI